MNSASQDDILDLNRLHALFLLTGPDDAVELQRRLIADLSAVSNTLAGQKTASPVLREQSHILMALSGTIGADGLYHLATVLNDQSKAVAGAVDFGLLAQVVGKTEQVIAALRVLRQARGPAP